MPPKKKLKVRNPGKPIIYKTNVKTGLIEKLMDEAKDRTNKIDSKKRKLIVRKNMVEAKKKVKKLVVKTKKKVKKLVVRNKLPPKKEIISELQKHTELTPGLANMLAPLELFGMLPVELRKTILTPKDTGTQVGVAPPLSEEQAQTLMNILDTIHDTEGFINYIYSWGSYEGGNFTDNVRKYWEKKVDQLNKFSTRFELIDLLQEPKMERIMISTRKKYGELEGTTNKLKKYFNAKGELVEDMLYNHDYEEYYPEDRYDLIYEDGDYNMSNRTRSTTNKLVKSVIDTELKPEMKQFKAFEKQMKKLIK